MKVFYVSAEGITNTKGANTIGMNSFLVPGHLTSELVAWKFWGFTTITTIMIWCIQGLCVPSPFPASHFQWSCSMQCNENEYPCQLIPEGQQLHLFFPKPWKCFIGKVQIYLRHSQHKLKTLHCPTLSNQQTFNSWHNMALIVMMISKILVFEMKIIQFTILKLYHLTTKQQPWGQTVSWMNQFRCCPCIFCYITCIFNCPFIVSIPSKSLWTDAMLLTSFTSKMIVNFVSGN